MNRLAWRQRRPEPPTPPVVSMVDVVAGVVLLGLGVPPTGVALGWAVRKGVARVISAPDRTQQYKPARP